MTIDEALERGDLALALARAEQAMADEDTPGLRCLVAILRAQLSRHDAALGALEALASAHPTWRGVTRELALCVEAERLRVSRRHDPQVAQRRRALAPPPPFARALLDALVAHAAGDAQAAGAHLEAARDQAPPVRGRVVTTAGQVLRFEDARDADALTGPMLEAFAPGGLIDVPFAQLASVELRLPVSYHDTLWMVAHLQTHDGKALLARVPALYASSGLAEEADVRLGAATRWRDASGYAIGVGARALSLTLDAATSHVVALREVARIDLVAPG